MDSFVFIPESKVLELLNYDLVYEAVKNALTSVSQGRAVQNARGITVLPGGQNRMFTMPGYLQSDTQKTLGCKVLTLFPENESHGIPSIVANILLMDDQNGMLQAIVAGTTITLWRTAAASAVATTYLHRNKEKKVLAIIGAGPQGKIHALAFQHYFSFKEVRIWNRTTERARKLVKELCQTNEEIFKCYENIEECVRDADVIVTATANDRPLVRYKWLKKGVHINALSAHSNSFELDEETYTASNVYIDNWEGAKSELSTLTCITGQIGDIITGVMPTPTPESTTVFQSLGMAVEDCAVARLIFDLYKEGA